MSNIVSVLMLALLCLNLSACQMGTPSNPIPSTDSQQTENQGETANDTDNDSQESNNTDTAQNETDTDDKTTGESDTSLDTDTNETADGSLDNNIDDTDTDPVTEQPQLANLISPTAGEIINHTSWLFESDSTETQWLYVGTEINAQNIFSAQITNQQLVNSIPQDGSEIFVTLWTQINNQWQSQRYVFTTTNAQVTDTIKKKVLVLGLDGVQFEKIAQANTPNLDSLYMTRAFTGGIASTNNLQATQSGPGWASILTGVWADQHLINSDTALNSASDSFLKQIESRINNIYTASIWSWPNPNKQFFANENSMIDTRLQDLSDEQVITESLNAITELNYDVIFAALDEPDHVAHTEGFSQNYLASIHHADEQLGQLLEAIKQREDTLSEQWLVLVVTDHGRDTQGFNHGGQSESERTVFIASNQPLTYSCQANQVLNECPSHVDISPTIFEHLAIEIDTNWKLVGQSLFQEHTPTLDNSTDPDDNSSSDPTTDTDNVNAYRFWAIGGPSLVLLPSSGNNGLTNLNDHVVAQLRAQINGGSYSEMSVPLNPYASSDPFSDPAVDLTASDYVTIRYQSNHDAILQLRQSGVHGGNHNQASLPASPSGISTIKLSLRNDFKWLGYQASTIDLSQVGKFNFAFLSQNEDDGYAEIIVHSLKIDQYQPQ